MTEITLGPETAIVPGDFVDIKFPTAQMVRGEVLYTPAATGDCWRIWDYDHKTVFYVQEFSTMKKLLGYEKHPSKVRGEII